MGRFPGLVWGGLDGNSFSPGTCILTACVDPVHSDDIGGNDTGQTETKLTGLSLPSILRLPSARRIVDTEPAAARDSKRTRPRIHGVLRINPATICHSVFLDVHSTSVPVHGLMWHTSPGAECFEFSRSLYRKGTGYKLECRSHSRVQPGNVAASEPRLWSNSASAT